jgi:protein involved in polysaccharide export with SLBB domain
MHKSFSDGKWGSRHLARALRLLVPIACLVCAGLSGCASLSNPALIGYPVRRIPPEWLGKSREGLCTIPLTALGHAPDPVYKLEHGDVLGIFIEGVLGDSRTQNPPVYAPAQLNPLNRRLPPVVGFPIPIREDGTISLPLVPPIPVRGLSVKQAEEAVRKAYLDREILKEGRERVLVSVMQERLYRVTVLRQELGGVSQIGIGGGGVASSKRGTGFALELTPDGNDVLTALSQSGGLPGLDAYNEIYIFKRGMNNPQLLHALENLAPGQDPRCLAGENVRVIDIPVRLPPGTKLPFRPEDVVLDNGDVIFIEARPTEVFFTGGLLPSNSFVLPRDFDLDVIRAIAFVQGTLANGAFNTQFLGGSLVEPGFGGPTPTALSVLRKIPGGGEITIAVDLDRALQDPRERILVQAGDVLILQQKPSEALVRYWMDKFNFNFTSLIISGQKTKGTLTINSP